MSRAVDARLRAEQAMYRAVAEAGFRRRIVEAGGMDPTTRPSRAAGFCAG
ncbi:MAG: hypothetical protein ACRD2C_22535 [Acidimicrobiales bacterium]